jgi:GT2 family glycosyltransferase
MKKHRVSICIISKDKYGYISRCIACIVENIKCCNYEILVCDTGTTDNKVKDFYKIYPQVQVFNNQKYHFSKNNNFLAKKASGDVILFMNNDVFVTYDCVKLMLDYLDLQPDIGCIGHRLLHEHNRSIEHDGQNIYHNKGRIPGLPGHIHHKKNPDAIVGMNGKVDGITGAFLMIRKVDFDRVNGFNEEYHDLYQDVDLSLKVERIGKYNFCVRDNFLIHVAHGTRDGNQKIEKQDGKLFLRKWKNKKRIYK